MADAIRVIQNGLGKMGTAALTRFLKSGIYVVGVADPHPSVDEGYNLARAGGIPVKDDITQIPVARGDILVDFSSPAGCKAASHYVADNKGKIVIGTTPLPKDIETDIYGLSGSTAVLIAPNYSPDFNKFLLEMRNVAPTIELDDSVNIYERHRLEKVATSGSAIAIAKTFCNVGCKKGYILFREGKAYGPDGSEIEMPRLNDPETIRDYVLIACERFGDEPGIHTVRIGDENDYRLFEVRATRASYARGLETGVKYVSGIERGSPNFVRDVLKLV